MWGSKETAKASDKTVGIAPLDKCVFSFPSRIDIAFTTALYIALSWQNVSDCSTSQGVISVLSGLF